MSPTPPSCTHELRPGTVVCLHCRHEQRLAAQARLRRRLLKAGGTVAGLFAVVAFATTQLSSASLRKPVANDSIDSGQTVAQAQPASGETQRASSGDAITEKAGASHSVSIASAKPLLAPVVAEGKTELGDGLFVVRNGGEVTVVFDTKGKRTRRRDKFERVVRQTLPKVFGDNAREFLAQIPLGELVEPSEQVTELTERGLHFALDGGASLALFPETRPARDGPLVVSYRATLLN